MITTTRPPRPVLRYHGSKYRIAPWVCAHLPPHTLFCEPFCGSAAVLLAKQRSAGEIINDLDEDVVGVFRVLRDHLQAAELERLLRLTPYAHAELRLAYEPVCDPAERARRTIVRSFMGHGSGCATRASRHGFRRGKLTSRVRTPATEWATYPDAIDAFVDRLQGVIIESRNALDVISMYDAPGALTYADPPYLADVRQDRLRAYKHEMTDEDHRRLAEVLHACRGMVVLSGYPSPLYDDELYPDWRRVVRPARDAAANERTEALWLSPAADRALGGRLF